LIALRRAVAPHLRDAPRRQSDPRVADKLGGVLALRAIWSIAADVMPLQAGKTPVGCTVKRAAGRLAVCTGFDLDVR
jgi:hypothetical protein